MNYSSLASSSLADLQSIVSNLLLLLSEKEKSVVLKRFSLQGNRRHTLEEIGQEFSVTRERIRQIEKSALNKMKRNVFNTSLKHLHEEASSQVRSHGGLVNEKTLIAGIKALSPIEDVSESEIHLSLVLHDDLDCVGNTIDFCPHVKDKNISSYSVKHASNQLVNQLHKYGDAKGLKKVHNDLKPVFDKLQFDLPKVKSLISIDKRLVILDDDLVALMEWRHINPRTLRDKILYVLRNTNKPMHFTEITERIDANNFDSRVVNLQAVHNELIRHDQFVLIGRGIYALADWGYERGTVADVIESILSAKKEMGQEEIIDEVLKKRQVKKITIVLALKNGARFERVGRKRYKLLSKKK